MTDDMSAAGADLVSWVEGLSDLDAAIAVEVYTIAASNPATEPAARSVLVAILALLKVRVAGGDVGSVVRAVELGFEAEEYLAEQGGDR